MGIGAAIARVLAAAGAHVAVHGYAKYDAELGYPDAQGDYIDELIDEIRAKGGKIERISSNDLAIEGAPEAAVREASQKLNGINGMVLNHAYSMFAPIGEWTREHILAHLNVNVLADMLMAQEFAAQLSEGERGAITLFTSGQYLGPMIGEIAYAVSKEATIALTKQSAAALAERNIQVNCVNPGPTDTGYLTGEAYENVAKMFPMGKWGTSDDAARLVHFLQSDYSRWITGEIIASEGGFRR